MFKRITATFMAIFICSAVTTPVSANTIFYNKTLPVYPNMQAALDALGPLEPSAEDTITNPNLKTRSVSTLKCKLI